jgi:F-type H+-transporting ATPase subunit b
MNEFLQELAHEHSNIYAIAFIIFWALVLIFGRKPLFQWLDGEIAKITAELTTARDLRAEAEAALADMKEKQLLAEKDARMIVEMAKKQVADMRKQAEEDLASTLERQKQMSAERIRMAEERAVSAIRAEAVKLGMELARKTLVEDLSAQEASVLVERAIADVPAFKGIVGDGR